MNKLLKSQGFGLFVLLPSYLIGYESLADVNSVLVDRVSSPAKIIVLGTDLAGASFKLAGVIIPSTCTDNISDTEQHIGFCTESSLAAPHKGSYNLVINNTEIFSIYLEQGIIAPPPPSISSECPCTVGWDTSGLPQDNSAWCLWGVDGTQEWIATQGWLDGSGRQDMLSAAFDPNHISFDPANVGNSISFCALYNGSDYTVAEPVVNWEQYDDCFQKMIVDFCL